MLCQPLLCICLLQQAGPRPPQLQQFVRVGMQLRCHRPCSVQRWGRWAQRWACSSYAAAPANCSPRAPTSLGTPPASAKHPATPASAKHPTTPASAKHPTTQPQPSTPPPQPQHSTPAAAPTHVRGGSSSPAHASAAAAAPAEARQRRATPASEPAPPARPPWRPAGCMPALPREPLQQRRPQQGRLLALRRDAAGRRLARPHRCRCRCCHCCCCRCC